MFLINAIYFKGPWKDPFDSQRTSHKIFYTANNVHVLTDMMIKKQHYVHGDLPNLNARFLEIPYSVSSFNNYHYILQKKALYRTTNE